MNNSRRNPQRNNNVRRIVTAKIRALEINHAPKWIRSKSRVKDPASYNATVPVARKLRFVTTTDTTGATVLSVSAVAAAIPESSGFTIDRIKVFGPAGDNRLLVVVEGVNGASSQSFDDYGTPGHERQCIDIMFPRTGLIPIESGSTGTIQLALLNAASTRVAGQVIVDLWVTTNWSIPTVSF